MSEDPDVALLWSSLRERWHEDSAHQFFIEHCRQAKRLDQAASLYRSLRDDGEVGEEARRRLAAIAVLAMAELSASRAPSSGHTTAWLNLVLALLAAGLVWFVWREWMR